MREICQDSLPIAPWMEARTSRLPGLNPVSPGDWLRVDEVYAAQMAYRVELVATKGARVHRLSSGARPAATELLERLLVEISALPGFIVSKAQVRCPDQRVVAIDWQNPLITCAYLVQEDLCILESAGGEHHLTGAVLCFPASWSLSEKYLGNLASIHLPVAAYTEEMAKRVQRVFDLIKPERPMWRANYLTYSDPDLYQPREVDNRRTIDPNAKKWMRVERQCLLRLPKTNAVIFSIHSYVVPFERLSAAQLKELVPPPI